MNFAAELWIPIVVSAVLVFVASSVIHMVLKYHNSEFRRLADEDAVRAAIRAVNPVPGQYVLPHCGDMKDMQTPAMQQKFREGPVALLTVRASGAPAMGKSLAMWFVFTLVIGVIAAYVASRTLPAAATFGQVARITGVAALLAYGGGSVQAGIWMGKPWSSVAKELLDAVIYAVVTGATFGWLWPH